MLLFFLFLNLGIYVYVPYTIWIFLLVSLILELPWLAILFVHSNVGQTWSNFVSLLFSWYIYFFPSTSLNFYIIFKYIISYVYNITNNKLGHFYIFTWKQVIQTGNKPTLWTSYKSCRKKNSPWISWNNISI
jgi:hypothetical protein